MFADLGPGKTAALVGLGITNQAVAAYLVGLGVQVTGYDQKTPEALGDAAKSLEELGVDLVLGPESFKSDLTGFDYIFVTPGIRPDIPMIAQGVRAGAIVTSEIDLLLQKAPGFVVGITGSSGKTTTTSLIGHIFRKAERRVLVGGNIGEPLIKALPEMTLETYLVLELSSFQLMTVRKSPNLAVITNITPNHLDYHPTMAEYIEAKSKIFANQTESGVLVANADDPIVFELARKAPGQVILFSRQQALDEGACLKDGQVVWVHQGQAEPVLTLAEIPLRGQHNWENVLAAAAVARASGIEASTIREAVREFKPIEHRLEFVREIDGTKYYNDSIATSPARAVAGLRSFEEPVILIAGGYDKKIPFDDFAKELPGRVKHLLLLGDTAPAIAKLVDQLPDGPGYTLTNSLQEAVEKARSLSEPGDVVLLSPACASFDMFPNYRERGRIFKEIVNNL
ncbi:MAG: UDP-N-acetylmuramoyl-L-alanine--D-glutamate ligase [Firmicutes bacterium]|nr:UDP-N-acetylmuramoyl-L-alanine--D-glutamate ligase [Bacillota bacterium]